MLYDQPIRKYQIAGVLPTHVEDGPNKIFLGNLPLHLTDQQVKIT
jgi:hypothetical protein